MQADLFSRFSSSVRRLVAREHNDVGNIAIVTALMLPVLISVVGFGVDYAYVAYIKQRVDRAAEAAVVGAISQSAATAMGGYSNTNGLHLYGNGIYAANTSQLKITNVTTPNVVVTQVGNGATATMSYKVTVKPFFSGVIGFNQFTLQGNAAAKATGIVYVNYYIILDISQSMGIGATNTDMVNLFNRVAANNSGNGCVFGCHALGSGQSKTNEYLAHNVSPNITLRVDAAKAAIQDVITSAQSAAGTKNNIKIGIYTMSKDPSSSQTVNTVYAPSTNFAALSSATNTIQLGNNNSSGVADSDFSTQLSTFNTMVPTNGSGASAASPLNYVFIMTDGMIDTPSNGCTWGHCTAAFSPSYCTALKGKSTVGVIYTTYLPVYQNNDPSQGYENAYNTLAKDYVPQIKPNLQSCASASNFFFEASDGPGITTAMQALFAQTQQSSILTN